MVPSGPRRGRIKGPGGHLFRYNNITAYFYINMYAGLWRVFRVGALCEVRWRFWRMWVLDRVFLGHIFDYFEAAGIPTT